MWLRGWRGKKVINIKLRNVLAIKITITLIITFRWVYPWGRTRHELLTGLMALIHRSIQREGKRIHQTGKFLWNSNFDRFRSRSPLNQHNILESVWSTWMFYHPRIEGSQHFLNNIIINPNPQLCHQQADRPSGWSQTEIWDEVHRINNRMRDIRVLFACHPRPPVI